MGWTLGIESPEERQEVDALVSALKSKFPNFHGPSTTSRSLTPQEVIQLLTMASPLPGHGSTKEVLLRDAETGEVVRIEPGHTSVRESLLSGHTTCAPVETAQAQCFHAEVH